MKSLTITEFNSLIKGRAGGYHIHELPVDLSQSDSSRCLSTAAHFNPYGSFTSTLSTLSLSPVYYTM